MNHKPIHEHKFQKGLLCALVNLFAWCLSIPSVPSVPQGVTARSTDSTTVLVTWMEPAASFREHTHNTTAVCLHVRTYVRYMSQVTYGNPQTSTVIHRGFP